MKKILLYTFLSSALLLGAVTQTRAQEKDAPKVEVGVQFTTLEVAQPTDSFGFGGGTITQPGFGGRFTYNLTDYLAVEAEGNFLPQKDTFEGRITQAQFGVKAGKRFRKFGVFAKARPGFVSFGETFTVERSTNPGDVFFPFIFDTERRTHFSFDVGGVLEFYPSRKIVTRFDAGDTIIRYGERNDLDFNRPDPLFKRPAETRHNFQFTAGVGFRFLNPDGAADDDDQTSNAGNDDEGTPRYEVGVQYTSLSLDPPRFIFMLPVIGGEQFTRAEPAIGGRFTFNFNEHFAVEAATDFFTRDNFPAYNMGGRAIQGQFGAKIGKRWNRFGVFGKARPGFISFSKVRQRVGTETITFDGREIVFGRFEVRRKTYHSLDLGGVFEFYPTRRLVTRFDVGDTLIRYDRRFFEGFSLSQPFSEAPPETKHNFQFTAGIGFRF